jgi:hypothetical protein
MLDVGSMTARGSFHVACIHWHVALRLSSWLPLAFLNIRRGSKQMLVACSCKLELHVVVA